MPLWFELVVTMLAAYGVGIGIGWGLWGRDDTALKQEDDQ